MKTFIITILSFGIALASSPVPLTWKSLLGSVTQDPKFKANHERIQLMKTSPGFGIWNELELRYEMDGFDLREHKLDVRISPFGFGEGKASQSNWQSRIQSNEIKQQKILGKSLRDRYRQGIWWIYKTKQLAFHRALRGVFDDRVQVHLSLSTTERFDPEDLVTSQQKLAELDGEILSDLSEIEQCEARLHGIVPGWTVVELDTLNQISAKEIRHFLDSLPQKIDSTYPEYRIALARLGMAERKQQLEKSSRMNVVSYVNAGYAWQIPAAGKHDKTTPQQDLNAGFGLRVPIGDGRSQALLRSQIDVMDEKSALLETQSEIAERMNQLQREVGSLVRQIAVQDSFQARVNAGALFTDYALRAGAEPLLLLKARAAGLQTSWQSEKMGFDVVLAYLEILETVGVLSRDPTSNHLKIVKNP